MTPFTRHDLAELNASDYDTAVSIYQPTHRAGPDTRQDPIRLGNLLDDARRSLVERGLEESEAEGILAPARRLVDDHDFWQHQSDGLAIFLAPEFARVYRLPITFGELSFVADRFHITPLLPLVTGDGQYFVLAISMNRVRLFEGTRHALDEIDLESDVPAGLADAVGHDVEQRALQFHTGTGGAAGQAGSRAAVFHGQGAGSDDEQAEIEQYVLRVDKAITKMLDSPAPPLVLACTEPIRGEYRKLSAYPNLVDDDVEGNHDETSADELHRQAWPVVERLFRSEQEKRRSRLEELSGTDRTCKGPVEILRAAQQGRVDTLFIPGDSRRWGTFDPESRQWMLHVAAKGGDDELFDLAAAKTLAHGGDVYVVSPKDSPRLAEGAAILRY